MVDLKIPTALLRQYDCAGPRYTSYPTAMSFDSSFSATAYEDRLKRLQPTQAVSLYVHLPFCEHRCHFCGCHVIATQRRDVAATYLQYLKKEIALLEALVPGRLSLLQCHLGGGTPTYYSPDELRQLYSAILEGFEILPDAELAIEVDPRVTTLEHIDVLAELGFNRISMGIQDFNNEVQEAIGRHQDEADTRKLLAYCREKGFTSINFDLIYGLPDQTPERFAHTLATALLLRPDRVALYSYAHIPWAKAHQKRIDASLLPSSDQKLELFLQALGAFQTSGYVAIGMDHFALPDDELNLASDQGRLFRNFMGYTAHHIPNQIGLGVSAIGEVFGAYTQNVKTLKAYYDTLDAGRLPVERGYIMTHDDRVRRYVIQRLMCNFQLNFEVFQSTFNLRFAEYFAAELETLKAGPLADGLVEIASDGIRVTATGRLLVRTICMIFDRYLPQAKSVKPMFSRTV